MSIQTRLILVGVTSCLVFVTLLAALIPSVMIRSSSREYPFEKFNPIVDSNNLASAIGLRDHHHDYFTNRPVRPTFYWPICHDLQEYERGKGHLSLTRLGVNLSFINDRFDRPQRAVMLPKGSYLIAPSFIYFSQGFTVL